VYSVSSVGNNSDKLPIAIVGGGITGLAAAHRLAAQGRTVRLFEAAPRLGGNIHTERSGGWLLEAGPNSLQLTPALEALVKELGLTPLTASPEAKNRYIVRHGRPVAAPFSPPGLLTSPLFSIAGKLRVLGDLLKRPRNRTEDVSLSDFIAGHFGRELVNYALNPFVSGIYAGNSEKLSARHSFPALWAAERTHGSLIRAQIASAKAKRARGESTAPPAIISFEGGLETLPRALGARLPLGSVVLNARVISITPPQADQPWQINWTQSSERGSQPPLHHTESFASVLLALPAAALAALPIGAMGARPLADLAAIEYPPVSSIFLGYKRSQVRHPLDGFGMLVPPAEKRAILGVLFNSTLFPERAPDDHVALTVMAGGALHPDYARLDDAPLMTLVQTELADLLGITGDPVYFRRHTWPRAIPQYNLGYERFIAVIDRAESDYPGLLIGGHVRDGISVPNCLAAGEKLAARALS
jgi:protoporphyrinogen/coproporphyrinogen III oxidase